jgi:hypothetical protein
VVSVSAHHLAVDEYLAERTGTFERRAVRYRTALRALRAAGLDDSHTIYDIGAGSTELDITLRVDGRWRGRYIPIDWGIDARHDLETWRPPRPADYAVALEVLEHLDDPWRLVSAMQECVPMIVVSVPNPRTVDVLGIDRTHRTVITRQHLESMGFTVREELFYGGVYSGGQPDALFATWSSVSTPRR